MNKNPFVPQPSYPAQQPPLPQGPPPMVQQAQPDYSAYWAAAAAQQQQQQQQPNPALVPQYSAQWAQQPQTQPQTQPPPPPPTQAPRPPSDQSALYANYGYGPNWQRQQQQQQMAQQQQQQYAPPAVGPMPPAPNAPAVYNPYQPMLAYGQSFSAPPSAPAPQTQSAFGRPQQQIYFPQQQPQQQQHHQQSPPIQQQQQQSGPFLPPAKRPRFDGPNQGPFAPASRGRGIPGGPSFGRMAAANRGGMGNQRGRGGSMINNRGGGMNRSMRGGMFGNNMASRGTPTLRGQGSRANFSGNMNRRGGGSFNALPSTSFNSGGSFRGRGQFMHTRGGGSSLNASASSSGSGKRDENRRTLTDFKIIGLEIRELGWMWGVAPPTDSVGVNVKLEEASDIASVKKEAENGTLPPASASVSANTRAYDAHNSPPSRIRVYFHTPVSADDSHAILHNASFSYTNIPTEPGARKGKRKKIEDDDGDIEEGRARPPPPQLSNDDRGSVAPSVGGDSVADTDWTMSMSHENEMVRGDETIVYDEESHEKDEREVGEQLFNGAPEVTGAGHSSPMGDIVSEDVHGSSGVQDSIAASVPSFIEEGVFPSSAEKSGAPGTPSLPLAGEVSHHSASAFVSVISRFFSCAVQPNVDHTSHSDTSSSVAHVDMQTAQGPNPNDLPQSSNADDSAAHQLDSQMDIAETGTEMSVYVGAQVADTEMRSRDASAGADVPVRSVDMPVPSANRISISYAGGTRRLVIDAEIVDYLKLYRHEGRIEVSLSLNRLESINGFKGIQMESLSEPTRSYIPMPNLASGIDDPDVPPFSKSPTPAKLTMIGYMDTERPLSEPKWAKTGDVHEWLKSMFGGRFWVAGDAAEGWEKKITVMDPDPAPTLWTVLDAWGLNSPAGNTVERQRFLKSHMSETDNILEILLRLVRGERATPFSQASTTPASNFTGPLLSALSQGSAHAKQQTHVSLAVLAIFRMSVEYAKKAIGDGGKAEVEQRVGEIIRCLPTHLIYKSLDGIFKEWRVEHKQQ